MGVRRSHRWGPLAALCLAAAPAGAPPAGAELVELEPVAGGLSRPLLVTHAGDGSKRLFVVEQAGTVRIVVGGVVAAEPFLDLTGQVQCCGEQGMLGLAFHPRYAANGRFFVSYTARNGDSVLARFTVSGDADRADAGSEVEILRFAQPFSNHNGGHLAFGPDGMLYLGVGDGGGGGDPQGNGQDLGTPLGKLLRLDVDAGEPFAVPPDNPFVGEPGVEETIWAWGLRNPWRFSFDRATGDLYLGDVGQNRFEEIDFAPAGDPGGANYGWNVREGRSCFEPAAGCATAGLTDPVLVYDHSEGCSVTGGHRYRGPAQPTLSRLYVYGDFCSGRIWGARGSRAGTFRARHLADVGLSISSFGEDEAGRLYVLDLGGGGVYRLAGRPLLAADHEDGTLDAWSRARGPVAATAPGLDGSGFALEVPVDGSARRADVRSDAPRREGSFEACFSLTARDLDLAGGEIEILRLVGGGAHTRLLLGRSGRRLRLHVEARGPSAGWSRLGSAPAPRRRVARWCLSWFRATGAGDGEIELAKNGRTRVVADGLDTRAFRVDQVRLGLPRGSRGAAGASGSLRIDDVVVTP